MSTEEKCSCCQGQETAAVHGGGFRIALAGNPNCGKTTLFNAYTGARQHVGNYPGVTVDRKEGSMDVDGASVTLVDIPGTYSLTAYSQEELVARDELSFGHVESVIDVADASALERNMLLTVQMLEMGMPVVLACNMMDEARKAGIKIDMKALSRLVGIPVLPLIARTGEGKDEVLRAAMDLASKGRRQPLQISYGRDIDEALSVLERRVADEALLTDRYHPHWTALKLLEGDSNVREKVREANPVAYGEMLALCDKVERHLVDTVRGTSESVITDARYGYVRGLLCSVVTQETGKDRLALSDSLDRILTHALAGPLIMCAVIYAMFWLTFELGAYPQGWVEGLFEWLGEAVSDNMEDGLLKDMLVDGVIGGVGGVLSFVPLIAIMFALIAFIEDSGYMARIAYMMDRVFRMFGLHGASVMPYIIGGGIAGGCAVPGVMATRTLRSPKEKLATLLTLPYMVCGAKVPVVLLLIGAFFPENPAGTFFLVLVSAWVLALVVALFLRKTIIRGEGTPFVMELPPYRMPTVFAMIVHCWERTWMYMKKAGTVILAISIVIWAGMTFPSLPDDQEESYTKRIEEIAAQMGTVGEGTDAYKELEEKKGDVENELSEAKLRHSYGGRIGVAIEPVTSLCGFTWRANIALVAGVAAKEAIVSSLGTAYSMGEVDADEVAEEGEGSALAQRIKKDLSKPAALALLLFTLLYSPCFVALCVIRSEAGSWWWLVFSIVFNTAVAFLVAFAAYRVGMIVWP